MELIVPEIILITIVVLMWASIARLTNLWGKLGNYLRPGAQQQNTEFGCLVEYVRSISSTGPAESFAVKIGGTVLTPHDMCDTDIQILIADITDGSDRPQPVLCTEKLWQMDDSPAFYYRGHNGRIPRRMSVLSGWVEVMTVGCERLQFPRSGKRKLKFIVSIIATDTGNKLSRAATTIVYDNKQAGYIDVTGSSERTDEMTVCLAEALAGGRKINLASVCKRMKKSATIVQLYGAVGRCLEAAGKGGRVEKNQTDMLVKIANLLEIDEDKFLAMAQKILPATEVEIVDTDFIVGLREGATIEQTLDRLGDEYRKWNGRVTHPDTRMRQLAEYSLTLITQKRAKYVTAVQL
jgi:hypothetical protein